MQTMIYSARDVQRVVNHLGVDGFMDQLIEDLEATCEQQSEDAPCAIPRRDGFHYETPEDGLVEWMPLLTPDHRAMMKLVGYHPANPDRQGLPTVLSSLVGFDTRTGHVSVFADGTLLTALRTGAASAVASRILASPATRTVGLIGAGAQAVSQLHALSRVFDVERVVVCDINAGAAASFAGRIAAFLPEVEVETGTASQVAERAEVLCTATSVAPHGGPVFDTEALRPGLHVNAVGSDFPGKFELPATLLERAFVCPDFLPQAVAEGESQRLPAETLGPSLVELVKGRAQFQAKRSSLTVFDSTGFALEDHVALELLVRVASELGVGTPLAVDPAADARDAYQGLSATPAPAAQRGGKRPRRNGRVSAG